MVKYWNRLVLVECPSLGTQNLTGTTLNKQI